MLHFEKKKIKQDLCGKKMKQIAFCKILLHFADLFLLHSILLYIWNEWPEMKNENENIAPPHIFIDVLFSVITFTKLYQTNAVLIYFFLCNNNFFHWKGLFSVEISSKLLGFRINGCTFFHFLYVHTGEITKRVWEMSTQLFDTLYTLFFPTAH